MPWYGVVFLTVYISLTAALIAMKLCKIGNRRRGVVKILTSASFVGAGIYACSTLGAGLHLVLFAGLVCAALGDVLLVFMDEHRFFVAGVLSFSVASLMFSVYSVLQYGWHWWSLLVFAAVEICNVVCQKAGVISYGKSKVYLNIYTVLVTACGALGLTLFCQGLASLPMFLFGLGCFLYFMSDFCLGLYMFRFHNRVVDSVNSVLYFPSMLLIALSLLF